MDWDGAIERQREELLRIVAALFAMAGLIGLRSVETLPRHIHRRIMLVLRPAESAVRRLIIATAGEFRGPPASEAKLKGGTREPNILSPQEKAAIIEQARLSRQRGREMQAREAYGPIHRQVNLGLAGVPAPGWKPPPAPGARQRASAKLNGGTEEPARQRVPDSGLPLTKRKTTAACRLRKRKQSLTDRHDREASRHAGARGDLRGLVAVPLAGATRIPAIGRNRNPCLRDMMQ